MKIAVLGAGYAGLACTWHLLHSPFRPRGLKVTLYDEIGVGGGASGIAAGLLHPYVGMNAKINWRGQEGVQAARRLIQESSMAFGSSVAAANGLLRVALTDEQEKNFRQCAEDNSEDVQWWEPDQCLKAVPQLGIVRGGIYILSGQVVHSKQYLQGLWKSCQLQGGEFSQLPIERLAQFRHYDRIIVAAGFGTRDIEELQDLPITLVKGQLLELEWPAEVPPLPFPVNSQAYVVMSQDGKRCIAGATYERGFESADPDIEVAKQDIIPKLSFLPHLQAARIISCRSHLRVSTKNHLPMVKQINNRCWVLTGMGSKGLLYHALFGQELAERVLLS